MKVSREEILHIANLAQLELKEEEIDTYILHLQDILNFANIVNNARRRMSQSAFSVLQRAFLYFKGHFLLF